MTPTLPLLSLFTRITLFTRANCSLCETAKLSLVDVRKRKEVVYEEIDIMAAGNGKWRDVYEFDVPVVSSSRVYLYRASSDVQSYTSTKRLLLKTTDTN